MNKFTLEEELDLFVHQQNRLRFQKLTGETTDAEQLKQLTKAPGGRGVEQSTAA
jgi:hypothetical protein